jgi:uncharacterized protein (TIGR02147 family)
MRIFEFTDYRAYLAKTLGKGKKGTLAKYIGCQPSFVSQVLNGVPNFSLEQGVLINEYLRHNEAEGEFFVHLLQLERAGSQKLKSFYRRRMDKILADTKTVESRIKNPQQVLDAESSSRYYSSWVYGALFVLTSIPTSDQLKLMRKKTGLSESEVLEALAFLEESGAIQKKGAKYVPAKNRFHIGSESVFLKMHHKNLRLLSMSDLDRNSPEDLRYSCFMGISRRDADLIKESLLKIIENQEDVIKHSVEESVYNFCMDFYELKDSSG